MKTNQRSKTIAIKMRKDEDWWNGEENVDKIILNFFTDLFSSSGTKGTDQVCSGVQKKFSREQQIGVSKCSLRRKLKKN